MGSTRPYKSLYSGTLHSPSISSIHKENDEDDDDAVAVDFVVCLEKLLGNRRMNFAVSARERERERVCSIKG